MKILIINGSPHKEGTTAAALRELSRTLEAEGIETETVWIGGGAVGGCIACGYCKKNGKCVFDDAVNRAAEIFREADGLIVGAPVYYASPNGSLISFLDRLFHSTPFDKSMKIGAGIVCARRGGCTASFDVLNKYFTISSMPIVSSSYWNQVHGACAEDIPEDAEGLRTVRTLARNMIFLMKAIALGKEKIGLPEREPKVRTSFVRR